MCYKKLKNITGIDFEHFIAEVLTRHGFIATEVTRHQGDDGIDVLTYFPESWKRVEVQAKYSSDGRTVHKCEIERYEYLMTESYGKFILAVSADLGQDAKRFIQKHEGKWLLGTTIETWVEKANSEYLYQVYSNGHTRLDTKEQIEDRLRFLGIQNSCEKAEEVLESTDKYRVLYDIERNYLQTDSTQSNGKSPVPLTV